MSYDLFFMQASSSPPIRPEAVLAYFRARPRYTMRDRRCWYENEHTGVYFAFDVSEPGDHAAEEDDEAPIEPGEEDGLVSTGVSFNMNYFRPHIFALEAELELSSFIHRFQFQVDDPQNDGMGRGAYSREGFLRSWNAGNLFGYYACLKQLEQSQSGGRDTLHALPAQTLERMWTWNVHRERLQSELGNNVFVPGIRLVRHERRPQTFVVWGDAIPQAMPVVDQIIIVRDQLAPRRWFKKGMDSALVGFDQLTPLLPLAEQRAEPVLHYLFRREPAPGPLVDFFRKQSAHTEKLDALSPDKVLTQEILDKASIPK